MQEISTLTKLKEMAIAIDHATMAMRPKENKKVIFNPSVDPQLEHCFCSNAGIVSFVTDGKMYAIPYMASVMKILNHEGFTRKTMNVPFSNDEYPIDEKRKWEALLKMVENERKERFVSTCESYADKHGYSEIAPSLLSDYCMKIPEDGVHVIKFQNSDVYYPEIKGTAFGSTATNLIGKYCVDKGVCSFVYRDGSTYVTKNQKVISALQSAGFRLGSLHIPFTDGEIITDTAQAEIWKRIA